MPIGIVAVVITITQVAESRDPHATGVDWAGLVTFSGALFMLVFALVRGNTLGWGSVQIITLLVGSVVLLALFLVAERLQARPMLDLSLFRRPAFAGASVVAFAISASIFALFLYQTLYLQNLLGYGPLQAGLRFLPVTLMSFFVAPISGRLSVRIPVRLLLGSGLLLIGIGLLLQSAVNASSGWTVLVPGFLLGGIGIGLVNPALASTAIGVVPPARSGMASGINSTFRQVGIATGIAGLGAVFQHEVTHGTVSKLATSPHGAEILSATHGALAGALQAGGVSQIAQSLPVAARASLGLAYRTGFTDAFSEITIIAAVIALVGSVLAFVLVRQKDFVVTGAPAGAPEREPEPAVA